MVNANDEGEIKMTKQELVVFSKLQKRLESLINATPSGELRNTLTEENIEAFSIIQYYTQGMTKVELDLFEDEQPKENYGEKMRGKVRKSKENAMNKKSK